MLGSSLTKADITLTFDPSRIRVSAADVPKSQASVELLKELTGWRPETSVEEGIEKTFEWYSTFRSFAKDRVC
jgi:nucleoside-diphosphate-sugar epimerase